MQLSDVIIVLSRPSEPGNIGAVCRAMKNMGLSKLRLAAPEGAAVSGHLISGQRGSPSGLVESPQSGTLSEAGFGYGGTLSEAGFGYGGTLAVIKARAVHALDVWERAENFDSLSAAVKDCSLVIGTTRRRGRHRKQLSMTPAEAAAFLKGHPGPAALVFGNERTGLEDEELELCNFASHIPAAGVFPSLNLSHAVMVYTYELFLALNPASRAVKGQWVPLDQKAIEAHAMEITGNLKSLGFYKQISLDEQKAFFRDLLSRAAITEREASYFAGIMAKAAKLAVKEPRSTENSVPSLAQLNLEDFINKQEKFIADIGE